MDCHDNWYYHMPTRVVYGAGSSKTLGKEARSLGAKKVLLVTDKGVHQAGVTAAPLQSLQEAGLDPVVFADVPEDPPVETVEQGLAIFRETGRDLVAIVGGGSPICAGKAIALRATNPGTLYDYNGYEKYDIAPAPVIAIPTTAGSGSEVSQAFIITDPINKMKMGIASHLGFPRVAILDPDLMMTLPYWQTVVSGVDALTHATEAYIGMYASPFSDAPALEAVKMIFRNLGPAASTRDKQAKFNMLVASTLANIASGNARLGLGHASSHPLCINYHLPHGYCNGIMLPHVLEFNLPAAPERYVTLAEAMGEVSAVGRPQPQAAIEGLKRLYRMLGFPSKLPEQVKREDFPRMAQLAFDFPGARTNLRRFTKDDIVGLYEAAAKG